MKRSGPIKRKTPLKSSGPIKRKPAKAKSPRKKAKDAAWKAFSRYIRIRDAIRTTGDTEYCVCVTCGKTLPTFGKGCIHAGHWLGGRSGKNLFEEHAVHGQCSGCNVFGSGKQYAYEQFMTKHYGHDVMDEIVLQANTPYTYSIDELVGIRVMYDGLVSKLTGTQK